MIGALIGPLLGVHLLGALTKRTNSVVSVKNMKITEITYIIELSTAIFVISL